MSKIFKLSLALVSILSLSVLSHNAHAQQYQGDISSKKKKYEDKAAKPVPKVFSSQVTSVQEAEKLDKLYDELYVGLWNFAVTDFSYQKKFYDLVQPARFETTRYSKEFSVPLKDAIENLNQNYKSMQRDIEDANAQYEVIKEGILASDYEILDTLWAEKIEIYRMKAREYFEMQHKFLKTYRSLVAFIIKQGGSYYYDSTEGRVKFYDFAGYKYFGQSIDKLRRITFEQKQMLRANAPANVDTAIIQ